MHFHVVLCAHLILTYVVYVVYEVYVGQFVSNRIRQVMHFNWSLHFVHDCQVTNIDY